MNGASCFCRCGRVVENKISQNFHLTGPELALPASSPTTTFKGPVMFFFILCSIVSVLGQTTHMVSVGDNGSFYDPPTVSAGLNDIVMFMFTGQGSHGVTQSTYSDPCTPLSGGFNSGLYSFSNSTNPNEAPVWSLQITDEVDPIYFFCSNTHPVSHCGQGMVGVINTPSQANYSAFVVLAKGTTTTLTSQPPYAATGSGAFALATPSPSSVGTQFLTATETTTVSGSSTSIPSSSSSSTSTATATPNVDATSKSHTGAIVGGAVGGCLVVGLVIIAVVYMLLRRHRQQQPQSAPSQQFPNYYVDRQLPPGAPGIMERGMGERGSVFKPDDMIPTLAMSQVPPSPPPPRQISSGAEVYGHFPSPYNNNHATYTVHNPDSDPVQNNPGHSRLLSHPSSDQMSLGSSGVGAGVETGQQQIGGKDINTLAKEIAAVLIQNNAAGGAGGTINTDETTRNWGKFAAGSPRTMSPPHYQAEQ